MNPVAVSALLGSLASVRASEKLLPSSTGPSLLSVAVGATLSTVRRNVAVPCAPCSSVAVMVTCWLSTGPSSGV